MELVILWAPWAIGKCWWVSTTWLRITAILSVFFGVAQIRVTLGA